MQYARTTIGQTGQPPSSVCETMRTEAPRPGNYGAHHAWVVLLGLLILGYALSIPSRSGWRRTLLSYPSDTKNAGAMSMGSALASERRKARKREKPHTVFTGTMISQGREGEDRKSTIWQLFKRTVAKWNEDHAPQLGAALAYYSVFSLAPLLLISIAIAGTVFGQEAAQGQIIEQIEGLVGEASAKAIQSMIEEARRPALSTIATLIAIVMLIIGATGVFAQLQEALNTIWRVEQKPGEGIWKVLKDRFISFLAVLGTGFLLLISLVISAGLSAVGATLQIINFSISFAVITFLFAMIYKLLPDTSIQWSDVWVGAGMTSLLFTIGKFLIGLYLGNSDVGIAYGAAGSLVVILIWVYYASQIFLLGAEFTAVYAESRTGRLAPVQQRHKDIATEGAWVQSQGSSTDAWKTERSSQR
jgi:membrane protein